MTASRHQLRTAGFLIASVIITFHAASMVRYLLHPSYSDHLCPHVTVQSQVLLAGGQIYTGREDANRGSVLYGPTAYLGNAAFLNVFEDPILGSKLAGVAFGAGALALLGWALWATAGATASAVGTAYAVLVMDRFFFNISYWNRPDPFILFGTTLAFVAVLRAPRRWGPGLLALGISIAVGGKITAAAYLLPCAWIAMRRWGPWYGLGWGLLGIGGAFLPFTFGSSFDLSNYVDLIRSGGQHSFLPALMLDEVKASVWILAPPSIALWIACRRYPPRAIVRDPIIQSFAVLAAAMALLVVPVAKEGSGAHHYLPFLPVAALITADVWCRRGIPVVHPVFRRERSIGVLLLAVWSIAMGLGALRTQERFWSYMDTRAKSEVSVRADLEEIVRRAESRSVCMGYAGGNWNEPEYQWTYLRPLLRNTENFLDAAAIMDRNEAGIEMPEATREKMRSRPFDWFVIPRGGPPFSMDGFFRNQEGRPLFGPLQEDFITSYRPLDSTRYFEIWEKRGQ